jgi:ACS family hexuronate transporter-like MFS transporter
VGEAGNWPAAIKLTSEWFPPEERSTAIGIFNSGAAVGAMVAPPLIAFLGMTYGWKFTFVAIGLIGYCWLAIFWFVYYTPKRSIKESKARIIPPMKLIKTRFVSWFTISKIFIDPVWYFITFWIARYLVDVHGWGLAKIGWFAMLPFIVADLGNILGGLFTQFIIKRGVAVHHARKIAVCIFGTMLAGSLILAPVIITSPATALWILCIAGFGYSAYTANSMAFPGDVVPQSAIASVWGLASVGAGLGGAVFQSITGVTVKRLAATHDYAFAYHSIFLGYGLMAMIALLIVMFLIGPLKKNQDLHDYALNS